MAVSKAKRTLGLVGDGLVSGAVNVVVLATAELVADRLSSVLGVIGLRLAGDLVGAAGDALLGPFEG